MSDDHFFPHHCRRITSAAGLSLGARVLLVHLHTYDLPNRDGVRKGEVWPRQSRLAAELKRSDRQIRYWLEELERTGWITRTTGYRGLGLRIRLNRRDPDAPFGNPTSDSSFGNSVSDNDTRIGNGTSDKEASPFGNSISGHSEVQFPMSKEQNGITKRKSAVSDATDSPGRRNGKPKKKSPREDTDPRINLLLAHFHDEHVRIIGEKPHIIGGRDSAAIKRMLTTIPDENELKRRVTAYLQDRLEWMTNPLHTLPGLEKRLNAYSDRNAVDDTTDTAWDKEF